MTRDDHCPRCGTRLEQSTSPEGLCPACLMQQALEEFPSTDGEQQSTEATDQPGAASKSRTIGPYRLLQKLGEGGMGEVWAAEQSEPVRRKVALKLIKRGMDTKQVIARFESERQALALMDHPAIAHVFDAGATQEGRPYFAMELVRGVPITEHCDRHRLNTEERLKLFMQVCEGVQHAHQKGIIHRDIKPSNVLVTIDGEKAVPKIIDFGVAKATEQRLTEKSLFTELGVLIGTPEYMSPEQADLTAQDIDTRTDVYSLGVLLYQLLAGALPFDSKELRQAGYEEIRRKVREDDPPKPSTRLSTLGGEQFTEAAKARRTDPSSLKRQLRGDLDWISMRALEKDRTRRYGSPTELAADVLRHLVHEPVLAGPPSPAYRAKKFVRRHRAGVGFAAAILLVLIGFAVTMTVQAGRIARERDRANDEAERASREAETANRVSEFMVRLFEIPDPGEARGKTVTAQEILDRGSEQIERGLRDEPVIRARLLTTMGKTYHGLGLFDRAAALLVEALVVRDDNDLPEDRDYIDNLGRLAWVRWDERDIESLNAIAERCVSMARANLPADDPELAFWLSGSGMVLMVQNRLDEARVRIEESLAIWQQRPNSTDWRRLHAQQAAMMLAGHSGDLDQVRRYEPTVLETFAALENAEAYAPILLLMTLSDVGAAWQAVGEYENARRTFKRALEWQGELLGTDHPKMATLHRNLASLAYHFGDVEEGLVHARQCLEISHAVLDDGSPMAAKCGLLLSLGLFQRGEDKQARDLCEESLDTLESDLGFSTPWLVDSFHTLAELLAGSGDHSNASRIYEAILAMHSRAGGRTVLGEAELHEEYAKVLDSLGRHDEAEGQRTLADSRRNTASAP